MLGLIAILLMVLTYLFQKFDFSSLAGEYSNVTKFVVNRTVRFIFNDIACLLMIIAIFNKNDYLKLSVWIFFTELFILLPGYFVAKLSLEGDSEISSPLLSQIHRMIVNPLLMIILIMGLLYQDYFYKKNL